MIFWFFFVYILYIVDFVSCYNILVVFSVDGHSHQVLGESLAKGLSLAGHNVTFLSPLDVKDPGKLRVIKLQNSFLEETRKQAQPINLFDYDNYPEFMPLIFNDIEKIISQNFFKDKKVLQLLNSSNETFDAIILEQFHNDAKKYLAYHFNCSLIAYSTVLSSKWVNRFVGNPEPPSYVSDILLSYNGGMNFLERAHNFIFGLFHLYRLEVVSSNIQNSILQRYFPKAPTVQELNYNVSLVLVNSHVSVSPAVPRVPNMIDIGGHHIIPPKGLPKNLQKLMDTATDGVIYFSMGSNLKPSNMPIEIRNALLKVLGARKEKVLFKWNEDNLPNLSGNINISKWFPQNDILAHRKLKVFITHCGLLSTTESLYHGVPILGLPIYSDQKLNAAQAEAIGIGKKLIFSKVTEESFSEALKELIDNSRYKQNARARSKIMHDRPMKPLETAIYWTEYVIRHHGAKHLRVAGADLPFYQYFLLDVVAVLLILLTLVFVSLAYFTAYFIKLIKHSRIINFKKIKKH